MTPYTPNDALFRARQAAKIAREAKREVNTRGSWWIGVPRDQWAAKCAEVFPEILASEEGQKPFRPWKTTLS